MTVSPGSARSSCVAQTTTRPASAARRSRTISQPDTAVGAMPEPPRPLPSVARWVALVSAGLLLLLPTGLLVLPDF
jgi:hypothetical protein